MSPRPARRTVDVPGLTHASPLPVAARIGRLVQSSAITGRDTATGEYPQDASVQAANAFTRLRLLLDELGARPDDVLAVRVHMRSLADRPVLDVPWTAMFPDPADRPARHVMTSDITQFNPRLRFQLEVTLVLPGPLRRLTRRVRGARRPRKVVA